MHIYRLPLLNKIPDGTIRTRIAPVVQHVLLLLVYFFSSIWFYSVWHVTISCMYILPLALCGLYCIRAQNGYGQHRPCKIVLFTLVTPRGVPDLYLSWGIHIEHARTAYHETCWTEYQQPYYRRFNSQTPSYKKWNIAQTRPTSVSDLSRSLQSWVSTTHRSYSQLTSFNIFIKIPGIIFPRLVPGLTERTAMNNLVPFLSVPQGRTLRRAFSLCW